MPALVQRSPVRPRRVTAPLLRSDSVQELKALQDAASGLGARLAVEQDDRAGKLAAFQLGQGVIDVIETDMP